VSTELRLFEDQDGQYVVGDYGEIGYGDWLVPSEQEAHIPVVVTRPGAELAPA
jgi:hypothetical protein